MVRAPSPVGGVQEVADLMILIIDISLSPFLSGINKYIFLKFN